MEEKEMSFWGHLEELRRTLFRVVAVLLVFMIACFCVMPDLFDSFVLGPTTSDFFLYRWLSNLGGTGMFLPDFSNDDFAVEIININVASQFLTHISTSFWFALVLMFPYLIFEVWRFVQPALFENERRSVGLAFLGGTVMFFLGCAVGVLLILTVNPGQELWFIVLFLCLQQIEGNLIYPHVVGESVGLPSIWVLAAVTIGGNLMGIVGMLVFIPLLSVFYTIFREFVYLRLKKKHIKQVTKTEIEEYTAEEIVNSDISEGK